MWDFSKFADFGSTSTLGYTLLAGFIFGTIGMGSFTYGKRLDLWQPRVLGVALMIYPYLVSNLWLLWGIGVGLLITLWFYHDQ